MMLDYKLIIFDWDGTLMNSIARIVSSMQAVAKKHDLIIPKSAEVKDIIGLSLPIGLEQLFPKYGQTETLIASYKEQYITKSIVSSPLFDGALSLLSALKAHNKLLAIATGKGREGLNRVLNDSKSEHFFHASCCADEAQSKPDPEMITLLFAEVNVERHQAVMIGDTSFDMEMAQRAGIDRIGVTLGVHDRDILSRYAPKAIVDSLPELQQLLLLS